MFFQLLPQMVNGDQTKLMKGCNQIPTDANGEVLPVDHPQFVAWLQAATGQKQDQHPLGQWKILPFDL